MINRLDNHGHGNWDIYEHKIFTHGLVSDELT